NLKQMGLAANSIVELTGAYPANGWGWNWVGVPSKGYNNDQPGGWAYNLLPFVEQDTLRKLGHGKSGQAFTDEILILVQTPVALFNCPTRRTGGPYPYSGATYYSSDDRNNKTSFSSPLGMVRGDYATCVGDKNQDENFGGIGGGDSISILSPPPPPPDCT